MLNVFRVSSFHRLLKSVGFAVRRYAEANNESLRERLNPISAEEIASSGNQRVFLGDVPFVAAQDLPRSDDWMLLRSGSDEVYISMRYGLIVIPSNRYMPVSELIDSAVLKIKQARPDQFEFTYGCDWEWELYSPHLARSVNAEVLFRDTDRGSLRHEEFGLDGNGYTGECRTPVFSKLPDLFNHINSQAERLIKMTSRQSYVITAGYRNPCGMHIHIGGPIVTAAFLGDLFANYLAEVLPVTEANPPARKSSSYSGRGMYRLQDWGIEWRDPPTALLNGQVAEFILGLQTAIDYLFKSEAPPKFDFKPCGYNLVIRQAGKAKYNICFGKDIPGWLRSTLREQLPSPPNGMLYSVSGTPNSDYSVLQRADGFLLILIPYSSIDAQASKEISEEIKSRLNRLQSLFNASPEANDAPVALEQQNPASRPMGSAIA